MHNNISSGGRTDILCKLAGARGQAGVLGKTAQRDKLGGISIEFEFRFHTCVSRHDERTHAARQIAVGYVTTVISTVSRDLQPPYYKPKPKTIFFFKKKLTSHLDLDH